MVFDLNSFISAILGGVVGSVVTIVIEWLNRRDRAKASKRAMVDDIVREATTLAAMVHGSTGFLPAHIQQQFRVLDAIYRLKATLKKAEEPVADWAVSQVVYLGTAFSNLQNTGIRSGLVSGLNYWLTKKRDVDWFTEHMDDTSNWVESSRGAASPPSGGTAPPPAT
jgi:hypothetical protein